MRIGGVERVAIAGAIALVACGGGVTYLDDSAQRAAVVDGKGFALVGFIPYQITGVGGDDTIQPLAVTGSGGTLQAIFTSTVSTQQSPLTSVGAGRFVDGWEPTVVLPVPRLEGSASTSFYGWRDGRGEWGFRAGAPYGVAWAYLEDMTLNKVQAEVRWGLRGMMNTLQLDADATPVFAKLDDAGDPVWAYRTNQGRGALGVARARNGAAQPGVTTAAPEGHSLALWLDGATTWVAALVATVGGAELQLHRQDASGFTKVASTTPAGAVDGNDLRIFGGGGQLYVAIATSPLGVYKLDGAALTKQPDAPGMNPTVAVGDDGTLYYGYRDPATGGASVGKVSGASVTPIATGVSRLPANGHVFVEGGNVYLAFVNVDSAALGIAITCQGATCPAYSRPAKKESAESKATEASCATATFCDDYTMATSAAVGDLKSWCQTSSGGGAFSLMACSHAGVVGGCRQTRSNGVLTRWYPATPGATASTVMAVCEAQGQTFVSP